MKVLHLISGGDVGGAKTHVISLLQGLTARMDVLLVVFTEGPFAQEARDKGVRVVLAPKSLRAAHKMLRRLVEEEKITLLHSHGSRGNVAAARLSRACRLPAVTTVHSDYRRDYLGRPFKRLVFGTMNKWALRRLGYYVGMSRGMTDMLCNRGFPPDRLYPIFAGLSYPDEPKTVDRAAYWAERGFSVAPSDVLAGIAARLSPVKDIGTLITAFSKLTKMCPRLKLVIAGDGEERRPLEQLAQSLGVSDRIFFAGWMEDMGEFYYTLDINLLTSLTEALGYSLLEGAQAACPAIGSRVGGIPTLIDDGVNGLLFPAGDSDALAARLTTLYKNPDLRKQLGQALLEKAKRSFGLEAMLDVQLSIYRTIEEREERPRKKRDGVIISGAYGFSNAGDDAILEGILSEVRTLDPYCPVTVLSRRPKQTRKLYGVPSLHSFNLFSIWRRLGRSSLFISGGGNLVQNVTSQRSLIYYLGVIWLASHRGLPVLMYGCGVGPLAGSVSRWLTRHVLNRHVKAITLRERSSLRDVETLGITEPTVTLAADPALTLPPAPEGQVRTAFAACGIDFDGRYIAFSLRSWPGFSEKAHVFARTAEYAYNNYGLIPVFVPIEPVGDLAAARQVIDKLSCPYHVFDRVESASLAIGVYARMKILVAMRLHALIFASGMGLPLIGVAYDEKVTAFLEYMGQELCVPFEEVKISGLCKMVDKALTADGSAQARTLAVERLRQMEKENLRMLASYML